MDQTQGSFRKNGTESYINDFFVADIVSSPRYRQDEQAAQKLMQMRLDSRGSPLRRTFLGNEQQYMQGKGIVEKMAKEGISRKTSVKMSTVGQNIVQSQVLPSIGVSPRLGIIKQNPRETESSRN